MAPCLLAPNTHTAPIVLQCPFCPLGVTDTTHFANIHTVMDKDRYAMTWDGLTEVLMLHHERGHQKVFQQVIMQQTMVG